MVIKFNLSQFAPTSEITKAVLHLYAEAKGTGDEGSLNNGAKTLYTISKDWTPANVKWRSPWTRAGGDFNSTPAVKNSNTSITKWEDFDVTDAVKAFVATPTKNFGFIVKMDKYSFGVKYSASENSTIANRPKLEITAKNPPVGTTVRSIQPVDLVQITTGSSGIQVTTPAAGMSTVVISNAQGKVISKGTIHGSTWNSALTPGVHIVSVKSSVGNVTRQVIVPE